MKRREMKLLLEERFERIALLETRIDTMDQLVEGYRAREQAVLDTLQTAKENAAKALGQVAVERAQMHTEAQKVLDEAEQVRQNAETEAKALLTDAISTANSLKKEAERKGIEITATVRADSERMLRDAEIIKREYEEMVDSFNAMLEQNASELEITAARFAEFVKNRKIDRTEVRLDGNAFYKSVGELSDAALPDASGDPALLMQNIYRIQNRPLPEDRLDAAPAQEPLETTLMEPQRAAAEQAVEPLADFAAQSDLEPEADAQAATETSASPEFPMEDRSGADERQSAIVEPYSEQAWANEAQKSESEPQAEFAKSFDTTYLASDDSTHGDMGNATQADAESEFDALMSGKRQSSGAAVAAIPTAAALTADALAAKPMADAARAFDAYFDETFEPSGKTAQDEIPQEQVTEPQGTSPEAAAAPEVIAAPEPYSEQAWANEAQKSESEPQAEFAKSFDTTYQASDDSTHGDMGNATQADAESEFDALMSGKRQSSGAAVAAIPTAAALTADALAAKPMADAARAFDAYFDETFEPSGKTAQDEIPQEQVTEPQGAAPETIAAPEVIAAPEPYSEQAWANEAQKSESEPQAEFAKSFDTTYEKSDYTVHADECNANLASTESEFNDYLARIGVIVPTTLASVATEAAQAPEAAAAPEPYSERAWANESFLSDLEPQAEGALFGEQKIEAGSPATIFDGAEQQPSASSEAEKAFDDYLAGIGVFAPTAKTSVPTEAAQAPEAAAAPEPYSERAWTNESFLSNLEPQAEGALFGEQKVEAGSPAPIYDGAEQQPSISSEAEKAFDDYLANIQSFAPAAPATENENEQPIEAAAPTQTEASFDRQPSSASDAERAFDDYLAGIGVLTSKAPAAVSADTAQTPEAATAPEPDSEPAWMKESFQSGLKPQAEGAPYDATTEPEEEEEPKPAPRRYNEFGEIREWEPEPEPDMGDIPTVSRYMGQSNNGDDISLDDLLDEIIKAGD